MESIAIPRFLPHRARPNRRTTDHRKSSRICCVSSETKEGSAAIVWFKNDLRVDDHPGLLAASKCRAVVPLYVLDRRILSRYTDETLELAIIALQELRESLKEQGSNLMIRFGKAEHVIEELIKEVEATVVFVEEEVEYHLCETLDIVKNKVEGSPYPGQSPRIVMWQTSLYETQNLMELPQSWEEFKRLKLPVSLPVPAASLPSSANELEWGPTPTLDDLKNYIRENSGEKENMWMEVMRVSAGRVLQARLGQLEESGPESIDRTSSKKKFKSAFVTSKGDTVGGGTDDVLNALASYLRYLEGTVRDDWQEVHARLRDAETRPGASFLKLFGPILCLGVISRRRIHFEAITYEKDRNGGFLSPFGYSAATVSAAMDSVLSMEWYSLMAHQSRRKEESGHGVRIWRWKGYLIQYKVVGDEGPAVLLVHGFGAFLEHYRGNIHSIANSGNRVWALTLLGFGKSEKPNIIYTEQVWAELLRDFLVEVVGEPAHCVGNSIGGYFVALTAFLWPALVKSVVLINSAGNVTPGYSPPSPLSSERRLPWFAWLGAQILLFYLRWNVKKLLKDCYPVRPSRADGFLTSQMLSASQDPGVLVVLESIFVLDLSIPLNYLLNGFEEDKVLVIQGMKDPISDSEKTVALLKKHCPKIWIKKVNAGHCPHDEIPEEVNPMICQWTVKMSRGDY